MTSPSQNHLKLNSFLESMSPKEFPKELPFMRSATTLNRERIKSDIVEGRRHYTPSQMNARQLISSPTEFDLHTRSSSQHFDQNKHLIKNYESYRRNNDTATHLSRVSTSTSGIRFKLSPKHKYTSSIENKSIHLSQQLSPKSNQLRSPKNKKVDFPKQIRISIDVETDHATLNEYGIHVNNNISQLDLSKQSKMNTSDVTSSFMAVPNRPVTTHGYLNRTPNHGTGMGINSLGFVGYEDNTTKDILVEDNIIERFKRQEREALEDSNDALATKMKAEKRAKDMKRFVEEQLKRPEFMTNQEEDTLELDSKTVELQKYLRNGKIIIIIVFY